MIFPTDAFYAPLDEDYALSQGDIVADGPTGRIVGPVHLCRSVKEPTGTKLGEARFGDQSLHRSPAGWQKRPSETIHARAKQGLAMVIWQDCQISKRTAQNAQQEKRDDPAKLFAGIAPIRPLTEFPAEAENIKARGRPPLFYLPPFPGVGVAEDCCVDLRLIWPVQQALLAKRLTTLSPASRLELYDHMFWFFTAKAQPTEVECPYCGVQLPPRTEFIEEASDPPDAE